MRRERKKGNRPFKVFVDFSQFTELKKKEIEKGDKRKEGKRKRGGEICKIKIGFCQK